MGFASLDPSHARDLVRAGYDAGGVDGFCRGEGRVDGYTFSA
jgi:hypothetical protein